MQAAHTIERFASLRVLVVGDALLDVYAQGSANRLCREGPVPVLDVESRTALPGGAANTAANCAALGAKTTLVTALGDDAHGAELRQVLESAGVDTAGIVTGPAGSTVAKVRYCAGDHVLLRADEGAPAGDADIEHELCERVRSLAAGCDAIFVSDYAASVVSPAVLAAIDRALRDAGARLFIDSRRLDCFASLQPDAVKPNFDEVQRLLGEPLPSGVERVSAVEAAAPRILEATGAACAAVTLDIDGAVVLGGDEAYRTATRVQPDSHAIGAGDTFLAALGLAITAGEPLSGAAEIAAAAALVVLERPITSACDGRQLLATLQGRTRLVDGADALAAVVETHRARGERIVFTNGCFDILHKGHIDFLQAARELGDVLVVAVNGDASVARLKGPGRPANRLADRQAVLAGLDCIDYIAAFDDDRPTELLEAAHPDVYAKGGNYRRETLPEAAFAESLGSEVVFLPYRDDWTTAGLLERMRMAAGAAGA